MEDLWPEESVHAPGCARTQRRQIERCGAWFGLGGSVVELEEAAVEFGVELHVALEARTAFQDHRGRRERAQAVCKVLDVLCVDNELLWKLLRSGAANGVCGCPYRCDEWGVFRRV